MIDSDAGAENDVTGRVAIRRGDVADAPRFLDGRRADLLLVELFDCGGFGERILDVVGGAWRDALREDAVVVPRRVAIRGVLVRETRVGAWGRHGLDPGGAPSAGPRGSFLLFVVGRGPVAAAPPPPVVAPRRRVGRTTPPTVRGLDAAAGRDAAAERTRRRRQSAA